jgi:thioredoxin reductase
MVVAASGAAGKWRARMSYDVIIIGAGPAGLSAALILGRCRRQVLVLDANQPRNQAARALHGYLTRDGIDPWRLRELGHADLARYTSVTLRQTNVEKARRSADGFEITTDAGAVEHARLLLLATGRVDPLPDISGFHEFYGRGVHHCPYCDGWENRGKKLVVFGSGRRVIDLAEELLTWSDSVTICSHGAPGWDHRARHRFEIITDQVVALTGMEAGLDRVHFSQGFSITCDALFFCTECRQRSALPEQLGCELDDEASVVCVSNRAKGVAGLYLAGNVRGGVHLAITAAAEGAEAAIAINEALLERSLER